MGNRKIKILHSYGIYELFEEELKFVEAASNYEYEIIPINHRKKLNWKGDVTPHELDCLYRAKNVELLNFYNEVSQLCDNVDVFYVDHECVYHPDFILELSKKVYTVYYSGDDPESSYRRSKPYLYAFDHTFCYGVYHNKVQKMTEKFLEWGAKKADLRPHGCWHNQYDHNISEEKIYSDNRDIDLIFVGGHANWERNDFILKLKKEFGTKFSLYGNWWGVIGILSRIKRGYGYMPVWKLPNDKFIEMYSRAKIGINLHQSFGPCNLRLYELPMNGVMQICDNKDGLKEIFELNKEVVAYDTYDEAVSLIKYYLENDELRKSIAVNAFNKAKNNYLFHQTFIDSMKKIEIGMIEKNNNKVRLN